ncbi:MAG: NADH-quinone oxidoreductase subunit A [Candidatus Micrarchaeota archaeon]|nr:NADH-quinone oxidoreductase subunit A [Candidatus Micrarchaeota archaeon]MDE1824306.1 NADH-quinone oxidoreductase subunit A [Candidatus Micrarchaeota archaeon]MDE1849747.1 NADH-quinone oxidoreductase subunit A [Candidatus Micrarchaeota archaeon]
MSLTYIAIAVFILLSIFMPLSMILTSRMLRPFIRSNPIESAPYESAEESSGSRISIMNEYIHYFPMFISFEIVVAVIAVWAPLGRQLGVATDIYMLGLVLAAFVMELLVVMVARSGD